MQTLTVNLFKGIMSTLTVIFFRKNADLNSQSLLGKMPNLTVNLFFRKNDNFNSQSLLGKLLSLTFDLFLMKNTDFNSQFFRKKMTLTVNLFRKNAHFNGKSFLKENCDKKLKLKSQIDCAIA